MMKKILTIVAALSFTASVMAQGPEDAVLFSQKDYFTSARTLAMGNAFVALGGDLGAIPINPAATAIYRHSEVEITPGLAIVGSSAKVEGVTTRDNSTDFKFNNAAFVVSTDTYRTRGLLNISFSLSFNRISDFNKIQSAKWTTSQYSYPASIAASLEGVEESQLIATDSYNPFTSSIPWPNILAYRAYLVSPYPIGVTNSYIASTVNATEGKCVIGGPLEQYYFSKSSGGIQQVAFNMGFNFSDFVYLGCNFNLHTVSYYESGYYSEKSIDVTMFQDGFVSMTQNYYRKTTGSGFNFQIGAIVTPVAGLRIGATFTTPTVYRLIDVWNYNMTSAFSNGNSYTPYSPDGVSRYRVNAPLRWSLGAAYTYEELALISLDWESVNYSKASLANYSGNKAEYQECNNRISSGLSNSSTVRAGIEIRPDRSWFVRGGYNWVTTPGNLVDSDGGVTYRYPDKHYASCGLGYRFGESRAASLDLAYQRLLNYREQYTVYTGLPAVYATNNANRIALTFIYRF